jgi:glycosyltransferase involved in cell wall biosynthesis
MGKILFVLPQYKSGGGNRVFIELANFLATNKENVEIIYPNNSVEHHHYFLHGDIMKMAIGKYHSTKIFKIYNFLLTFKYLLKTMNSNENSILVISDPILSLFLLIIPKKFRLRTVRFIQANDYSIFDDGFILKRKITLNIYKKLVKSSYRLNVRFVFNSEYTYQCFQKIRENKEVKKVIIHPAVDKNIFYPKKIKSTNKKVIISLVGRPHPLKGFIDFLKAWELLDINVKRNVFLVNIITSDDLSSFNTQKFNIVRPKSDKEIADILRQTDIFISTSKWEGFGLPPLEAMNCGSTVITSDSGGIDEYIIDGINALKYQPGDVLGLSLHIEKLVLDVELREKLISNLSSTISSINWEVSGKKFQKFLNDLI